MHPDKLVSVQIPPTLKKQLVDDCEFITHMGKVALLGLYIKFLKC